MKHWIWGAGMLLMIGTGASADLPEPVYSTVLPQDDMQFPRVVGVPSGEEESPHATMYITVRDFYGNPVPNAFVELIFNTLCRDPLCTCNEPFANGYADENGYIELNIKAGGCCEAQDAVTIIANGINLRYYDWVVSPDHNGEEGDCAVDLADFATFANAMMSGMAGCADMTGDGAVNLADFVGFRDGWMRECDPSR